jgi:hypothetical protein
VRRVEQQRHQRESERAAVEDLDVGRQLPFPVQGLDAAYAETFVGPQQVTDAEDLDARCFLGRRIVQGGLC